MTRSGIIFLILVQALLYALPSLFFGLLIGQACYLGISYLITATLQVQISYFLTTNAILWSCAIGIIIPIASSILPIYTALGLNLRDSLDTTRSKVVAVKYNIERSNDSVDWIPLLIGSVLTVFGFMSTLHSTQRSGSYYIYSLLFCSIGFTFSKFNITVVCMAWIVAIYVCGSCSPLIEY